MNRQERKQRLSLTLFFAAVVFLSMFVTILLAGILVYLATHFGVISLDGEISTSQSIMLMMLLSILIGAALTMAVIRIPLNPFYSIISGMRKLAQGDYKARLNMGHLFSMRSLGGEVVETFNTLAAELESTEMLRSDFINNFSHEFKTPIVSIAGFAKLLKRGNLSEEQKLAYLDVIEQESLRLSYMATNVLNLTKVENQSILTDLTEYNLSEQLRTCVLMLEPKWSKRETDLSLEFEEHVIRANEELMKQVWINLIDNAVKFSPVGGAVSISVQETEGELHVSITNTGEEIPPESRERIFNKFYQADESHATEGNGIGLAIVRHITELHRGSVKLRCGDGYNTFTVSIPKNL